MITLSRLFVHPVKSMRGMQVSHAQALTSGLAFDRIFMLTEPDGTFITARQYPEMVLFTPALIVDGLHLSAPDGSSATVRFADFLTSPAPTEVWGSQFTALIAPEAINQWLSSFFPRQVQLRWVGPEMTRRVKRLDQVPLGFADGYPFLLVNEASLRDLQQRCPAGVKMEQFRPNLVVSGASAWAEDSWASLRIGEIIFDVPKPCSRCVLTTISTQHGRKHPRGEPLNTLQGFRSALDGSGDIDFGLNLVARSSGVIRAGDRLEVLTTGTPRAYGAGQVTETLDIAKDATREVVINWQGQQFNGNNQQVLLEQLELQGIKVPYSCRSGICGSCKVTLVSGDVKGMKKGAVRQDGTVLSCSCIPAGDLVLR
ncbi:YcbX family protein [Erwinia sorbitola]|uniref:MOSC domain-containing protein n=1 Tax=Erwinia sorbitola TaxID=2681984 RepID=A0A6I6EV18_9GAMM|nr:YcbX family protein [Erwinia sorbitola]MTD26584.1 MOSC domain-containing protein [Erwinia sorbitola]QGU88163.1 MOSC domain-containing protein [Erwinia sorbitola]